MNSNRTIIIYSVIILFFLFSTSSFSQEIDKKMSVQTFEFADPIYGVDQRLVSGEFYSGAINSAIIGHPYFFDKEWKIGSVEFDKIIYENLLLKYDIEKNSIILSFTNINGSSFQISLKKNLITSFTMDNYIFVQHPGTNEYDTAWFSELLTDGEISYLVLRKKALTLNQGSGSRGYYYKENVKQYLYINGDLMPFRTKKSLFRLFPVHKQEIRKFLRSAKLSPTKKRIADRAAMIRYVNELIEE